MAVVIEHRTCLLSFRDVKHFIAIALSIFVIRAIMACIWVVHRYSMLSPLIR